MSRYPIGDGDTPARPSVSEAGQAGLEGFIRSAKILIGALGHKAFRRLCEKHPSGSEDAPIFHCRRIKAKHMAPLDGFVPLRGSFIHESPAGSLTRPSGTKKGVGQSRAPGGIKDGTLQVDKLFSSPSAAAAGRIKAICPLYSRRT